MSSSTSIDNNNTLNANKHLDEETFVSKSLLELSGRDRSLRVQIGILTIEGGKTMEG